MGPSDSTPAYIVRFGVFEANLATGELRKNGVKIRLQEQPFQILASLLEKPGEMVTREELHARLWPEGTFVDFEHSLNKAINKLRDALGDSATNPRFIETVARRGYRFIAPAEGQQPGPTIAGSPAVEPTTPRDAGQPSHARFNRLLVLSLVFGLILVAGALYVLRGNRSAAPPLKLAGYRQLTHDGLLKSPGIATDGLRVYFSDTDVGRFYQVSVSGGDSLPLPAPFLGGVLDVSPNRQDLLVTEVQANNPQLASGYFPVWILPLPGGPPRRLGGVKAIAAAWSPDGSRIAYSVMSTLSVCKSDGSEARKVADLPGTAVFDPSWTRDGDRVRFLTLNRPRYTSTVWEVDLGTKELTQLLPAFPTAGMRSEVPRGTTAWMPDRMNYLVHTRRNGLAGLWSLTDNNGSLVDQWEKSPRLTQGPLRFWSSVADPNGKTIYSIGGQPQGELLRYDPKSARFLPFLPDLSAECVEFSPDGQSIAYVNYPGMQLWRARADGSDPRQLSPPATLCNLPRWSPDGRTLVFAGRTDGDSWKIFTIPAEGGVPKALIGRAVSQFDPNWSPDGSRIVYSPLPWETPEKEKGVFIVDLKTGIETAVPDSQHYFSPRWSHDGRFLIALREAGGSMLRFEFKTQKWTTFFGEQAEYPSISEDDKYVYYGGYVGSSRQHASCRVRLSDGVPETVCILTGLRPAGFGQWFGLAPGDLPMICRDLRTEEIYALDLESEN